MDCYGLICLKLDQRKFDYDRQIERNNTLRTEKKKYILYIQLNF